jgi:hypothetical protein
MMFDILKTFLAGETDGASQLVPEIAGPNRSVPVTCTQPHSSTWPVPALSESSQDLTRDPSEKYN